MMNFRVINSKDKNSLAKRHVGPPSRFVYDREMPESFFEFLKETFDLGNNDFASGRPLS
jgi:polyphosphate kinase